MKKILLCLFAVIMGLSSAMADEAIFTFSHFEGQGIAQGKSDGTSTIKATVGDITLKEYNGYAKTGGSYFQLYANSTSTFTVANGGTITKIVITTTSVDYNGFQKGGTMTTNTGSVSADGTTVTWTGDAKETLTIQHNKQIRTTQIVVTYTKGGETPTPTVTAPTISGETSFSESTTVTITANEGLNIFYTLDGTTPDDGSTPYTAPFTLTETTTVKAVAMDKDGYMSSVVEKKFTKSQPVTRITVAEFLNKKDTETIYELEGVVTKLSNTQFGNFYLAQDGSEIYIYGVVNKEGQAKVWESLGVQEGDNIVIQGKYTTYKEQPQIANAVYVSHVSNGQGVDISNTPETAYTVSKAHELIAAGKGLATKVFVKGKVIADGLTITPFVENDPKAYGNATYTITDGTKNLIIFRGYYLNNQKFTSTDQLKADDEVIVYGQLVNYNGTYEVTNNYIHTLNGTVSGINTIENSTVKASAKYNLAGQKVADDYCGIVIENGRKYIKK